MNENELTKGRNPLCQNDYLWSARDEQSSEDEVSEFLYGIVRLLKPLCIVETGCYLGDATIAIAKALKQNKYGKLYSCDIDMGLVIKVNDRLKDEGLIDYAEVRTESGNELIKRIKDIDFAFIDSGGEKGVREQEVNELIPLLKSFKMFAMHDTAPHKKHISAVAENVNLPKVYFNTPRGLTLFMKK